MRTKESEPIAVATAILAAGASRRLGTPKQLIVDLGAPLVVRMAAVARGSLSREVAVILGAARAEVEAALVGAPVTVLFNEAWPEGMASSIRTAVKWASGTGCDAALLMACDQPFVTEAHLDRLIVAYGQSRKIIASRYGDTSGIPAVFPSSVFPALLGLRGDRGAAAALDRSEWQVVDFPEAAFDVDTPTDLASLRQRRLDPDRSSRFAENQ